MQTETLGGKIRKIRMEKGITQTELGLGLVTPSMVSQIESGKANPSYKVLEEFAVRLETPIDYFLADLENRKFDVSRFKIAKALIGAEKYENATTILEDIYKNNLLDHHLNYAEVTIDLATCYLKMARFEDALKILEDCLQRCKDDENSIGIVLTLYKIGLVELEKKKYYSAIFYLRSAFTQFESLEIQQPMLKATLALELGKLYQQVGDTSEALKTFESVNGIINANDHPLMLAYTYLGLSESYLSLDEYQQATNFAAIAAALFEAQNNIKEFISISKRTILMAVNDSNYHEAVDILSQYVTKLKTHNLPLDAGVLMGEIAELHLQHGHSELCLKTCKKALKDVPEGSAESAPILRTLGLVKAKSGHFKVAIQQLQQAIEMFQQHDLPSEVATTYEELASVYEQLGDYENSNSCLHKMKKSLVDTLQKRGIVL